jgi:hypothetical protein
MRLRGSVQAAVRIVVVQTSVKGELLSLAVRRFLARKHVARMAK